MESGRASRCPACSSSSCGRSATGRPRGGRRRRGPRCSPRGAWGLRPEPPPRSATPAPAPRAGATGPRTHCWFGALFASCTLEGAGYVIAGTFLVAAINQTSPGWIGSGARVLVGPAAIPSAAFRAGLGSRWSRPDLLLPALGVQAVGIALPVWLLSFACRVAWIGPNTVVVVGYGARDLEHGAARPVRAERAECRRGHVDAESGDFLGQRTGDALYRELGFCRRSCDPAAERLVPTVRDRLRPGDSGRSRCRSGADEAEARAVLAAPDAFAAEVRADERLAADLGTTGVPFFVLNRRYGASGVQSQERFTQVLDHAWAGRSAA
ncbi:MULTISPECIES: YbfB/YjiJ family MFS transporter [Streptomyces]|uniref:YbfB/YjiJ family MFS transporter n=2 Tax=Streptomyces TaxID=1883 RepID=A0ABV9J1I3_9ACTN